MSDKKPKCNPETKTHEFGDGEQEREHRDDPEKRDRPLAAWDDDKLFADAVEHLFGEDEVSEHWCERVEAALHEFRMRLRRAKSLTAQAAAKTEEMRQAAMRGDVSAMWSQLFMHFLPKCEERFGTSTRDAIVRAVKEADAMASLALKTISEQ